MYLVVINKVSLGDEGEYFLSPKIEKLQAFEFQLKSKDWGVIDCVPEKGAPFEVHYGDKKHTGDMGFDTVFVAITSNPEIALYLPSAYESYAEIGHEFGWHEIEDSFSWRRGGHCMMVAYSEGAISADGEEIEKEIENPKKSKKVKPA